ncbi:MAG: hypothetical protein IJ997_00290 [Mycoplasmataceae bacterium]|nr:hypothetical protein [Mycoplasmataceae bacterium]
MSVKNYEVTNNGSNTLHINIYNIYKDYEMRNGISGEYVYKLNSETKSINTGDSLSNYIEVSNTANVVNKLKEQKYKDIYDTYSSNKFFLLDAADNLQSKTPYTARWTKNNAYDYYNIPMNIFIPITDGNVPQCNTNSALQDISTNIKLINNFYTQKFIPTNIKYTYSNKCSTLPSSNTEVLSTVIQLTEYSNNHNIYVPGPIKKIERDGYNINVWYYKVNNLYANSYANDIVTISKPSNINLYQAQSDGSLTTKNVTLPYYLPIAAATPESSLPISNLPPSLLNENHFGLYSYADDNKLKLSCNENDFLAGYSLKYQTNKYKITPYCIHFSNEPQSEPEPEQPEQQPEEPKICRGEEYLNHRYEDTEAGKEFIINEGDPCEIRRLCNNGIWDEPISKCNCFIDNITLDEGVNYELRNGTNATVYTCKRNGDYVELVKTSEKCVKDDKLYEEGEFTSSAMNDVVKYDKCVRENDKLTMKEINVCIKDGQEYNIGDSYSSSCDIGEGSIVHTCDNSGWKTDNKCTEKVEDDYTILIIIITVIIIFFIVIIFLIVMLKNKKQSKIVRT